jgi:hypothetical protein
MQERRNIDVNPFSSIFSILTMVLIFVGLFFIARSVFTILAWIAPFLIVATIFIDHKVFLGYGKWLLNLLRKDLLIGIGGILLTVFGFPIIAGFLFGKALLYRKMKKMNQGFEEESAGEFLEYEEIDEDISSPLELPTFEKEEKQAKKSNDYEQLFGEDL